jgi:LmbE family N-acetylglucosaminyl deacetylase
MAAVSDPVKSPADIHKLGTIMGVWAHPDDETFSCAGLLAAATDNGQTVVIVTATKGELGSQDLERWPLETVGDVRAAELKLALKELGIKEHHWLDYRDGALPEVDAYEAVGKLVKLINEYKPDTILTFGPDGITGHEDHKTVSAWVDAAVRSVDKKPAVYHAVECQGRYDKYFKEADKQLNIYFKIDKPPLKDEADCAIWFHLDKALLDRKYEALKLMPSQTVGMMAYFTHEQLCDALCCEPFVRADPK